MIVLLSSLGNLSQGIGQIDDLSGGLGPDDLG
jgi:hypothetical protein